MRILKVNFHTNKIAELADFYGNVLELPLLRQTRQHVFFQAGSTELAFSECEYDSKNHFAFNIPENQFAEAKQWLSERVPLISHNGEDEFDFVNWNAHSLYFFDPAGNIVEFIARHDLDNGSDQPFSGAQIRSVSEVGFPLFPEDFQKSAEELYRALGIEVYKGSHEQFYPLGDPEGLLICVPIGRNWFPTEVPSDKHGIEVLVEANRAQSFFFPEGYSLKSQVANNIEP